MATRSLPPHRRVTSDEFLAMELEGKFELIDGVIYAMGGGSVRHGALAANILIALGQKLRGSGCRPYGSDVAVKLLTDDIVYPDVSVYCHTTPPDGDAKTMGDPTVIVEVLSPSTKTYDMSTKLEAYRALPGVQAVLLVDGASDRVRLVERTGPEAWTDRWLDVNADVPIAAIGVTLGAADIFAA